MKKIALCVLVIATVFTCVGLTACGNESKQPVLQPYVETKETIESPTITTDSTIEIASSSTEATEAVQETIAASEMSICSFYLEIGEEKIQVSTDDEAMTVEEWVSSPWFITSGMVDHKVEKNGSIKISDGQQWYQIEAKWCGENPTMISEGCTVTAATI